MNRNEIISMIKEELERCDKYKEKFSSVHEGYAVLLEEVDELWDEIKKSKGKTMNRMAVREAIQVSSMAIKMIENLYRGNDGTN